jgi:UDP:flavonoid glycosyltransferase YjiC (YdhE family)
VVLGHLPVPRAVAAPLTAVGKRVLQWELSRVMRRLARDVGATKIRRPFIDAVRDGRLHLAMWSPALRGLLPGDPASGRICGFVRGSTLGDEVPQVPAALEELLAAGPPPVVVGLGSVFGLTAGPLLDALARACVDLGQRCLSIGPPPGATFPGSTLAVPYAPYDGVFPRASVVVVHGGAGTTGEALRSGRPVLGVPFAFDQFTLCAWMERLGVGMRLRGGKRDAPRLAAALRRLLSDRAVAGRAAEVGVRFAAERDGAEVAALAVERLERDAA